MTVPQAAPCMLQAWQFAEAELRGFLRHQLHDADAADDLLHEVFLKAMRQGGRFCQIDNARAWLFQVARNLLVDRLRLTREQVPLPDDLLADAPPEIAPVDLLSHCLPRVVAELSAVEREAIVLCHLQGVAELIGFWMMGGFFRPSRFRRSQVAALKNIHG